MLFNSLQFVAFFIVVYILYRMLGHGWQNRMLLAASCIFYGAWDWRFLGLMFASITVDFFCAKYIHRSSDARTRKVFLALSLAVNLGILGFFKYFNFFTENLQPVFHFFGLPIKTGSLHIILPVGISFYTFQAMSYAFDVYRRELVPVRNYFDYALFVTYFPQLVAGPIERAKHLLPQVLSPRKITPEGLHEGSFLVFWGLFQKVFIADNLAKIVEPVFAAGPPYDGTLVLVAAYAFTFQIYCDFAGYSNIARGLAKWMGFDIMFNFNLPYFSTNPREFWSRWHISLSTWLKDYLYVPLGGNRKGEARMYVNLFLTMFLGGLWHGAKWTFVLWGAYHGFLLVAHRILEPFLKKVRLPGNGMIQGLWAGVRIVFFFHLICLGLLFFRAGSLEQICQMVPALVFVHQLPLSHLRHYGLLIAFFMSLLFVVEIFQYRKNDLLAVLSWPLAVRFWLFAIMFYLMLIWGEFGIKEFIYFQF